MSAPVRNNGAPDKDGTGLRGGIALPRLYDLLILLLTRGHHRVYFERILDLAAITPGDRVLDIGCGTGTLAITAWRRTQPRGSVEGVDVSESMLSAARRKAGRAGLDLTFHQGNAAELPFESGCFDAVTLVTVMHMIPKDRRGLALQEAVRILKPGGRLLLVDYAGDPQERLHWSARHGPHGRFDLHRLWEPFAEAGIEDIEEGPINWLSLHFMRGRLG